MQFQLLQAIEIRRMPPTPSNLSSEEWSNREQVVSFPPSHTVICFLITTLGVYLQVYCQSRKLSPFDKHGNIMSAIYVFLSMYAAGLMAEFKLQIPIIKRFTPLIGILIAVLHLIILDPLLGLVAFIMWALYMMKAVLQEIFQWFLQVYSHIERLTRSNLDVDENHSIGNEENGSTVTLREDTGLPVEVELATEEISNR